MIIRGNTLGDSHGGFFKRTESEFLGAKIDYKFMSYAELAQSVADSANLYNEMFPFKRSLLQRTMRIIVTAAIVIGTVATVGAAILATYGVGLGTALGAVNTFVNTGFGANSMGEKVQKVARTINTAGGAYGKITGDTPKGLMKAASYISSPTALAVMEKATKQALARQGAIIQRDDVASNDALREQLMREQALLADKMRVAAKLKAEKTGQTLPDKGDFSPANAIALITPFALYFLG